MKTPTSHTKSSELHEETEKEKSAKALRPVNERKRKEVRRLCGGRRCQRPLLIVDVGVDVSERKRWLGERRTGRWRGRRRGKEEKNSVFVTLSLA